MSIGKPEASRPLRHRLSTHVAGFVHPGLASNSFRTALYYPPSIISASNIYGPNGNDDFDKDSRYEVVKGGSSIPSAGSTSVVSN